MNGSRRVEAEDVSVDRDTGATILVGSLEVVDVCIYMNMVRMGRQRQKSGK